MIAPKLVREIFNSQKINISGHLHKQPLPHPAVENINPFFLIHLWINVMPGGERQQDLNVGPHSHRGFSPVMYIFKGDIQHKDSLGNNEIVKEGKTQWMLSGKGIIHNEDTSKKMSRLIEKFELNDRMINKIE